jgi:hypothetical protein
MYAKVQYFWNQNSKRFLQGVGHVMCEDDFQLILDKVFINLGFKFTTKVTKDF